MRMIHQLAQVIAKVLKLTEEQQYSDALEEVGSSAKQLLGMDLRMLTTLTDEEFVRLLSLGERFDVEKCVVSGELLRLVGEVREREGNQGERHHCYTTSLSLFLELLIRESGVLPREYHDEIEWLIGKVYPYEIPVGLQAKLIRYYEAVGRYDRAENILFDVVQRDASYLSEGLMFYGRLRSRSDEELEHGNLPRKEIEASERELETRNRKFLEERE